MGKATALLEVGIACRARGRVADWGLDLLAVLLGCLSALAQGADGVGVELAQGADRLAAVAEAVADAGRGRALRHLRVVTLLAVDDAGDWYFDHSTRLLVGHHLTSLSTHLSDHGSLLRVGDDPLLHHRGAVGRLDLGTKGLVGVARVAQPLIDPGDLALGWLLRGHAHLALVGEALGHGLGHALLGREAAAHNLRHPAALLALVGEALALQLHPALGHVLLVTLPGPHGVAPGPLVVGLVAQAALAVGQAAALVGQLARAWSHGWRRAVEGSLAIVLGVGLGVGLGLWQWFRLSLSVGLGVGVGLDPGAGQGQPQHKEGEQGLRKKVIHIRLFKLLNLLRQLASIINTHSLTPEGEGAMAVMRVASEIQVL